MYVMSIIEDEFRDRFKDHESMEGIDADQIWKGISENLAEEEPIVGFTFIRSVGLTRVLMATIFILLSFIFFCKFNSKEHVIAERASFQPNNSITNQGLQQIDNKEITYDNDLNQEKTTAIKSRTTHSLKENKTKQATTPAKIEASSFYKKIERKTLNKDQKLISQTSQKNNSNKFSQQNKTNALTNFSNTIVLANPSPDKSKQDSKSPIAITANSKTKQVDQTHDVIEKTLIANQKNNSLEKSRRIIAMILPIKSVRNFPFIPNNIQEEEITLPKELVIPNKHTKDKTIELSLSTGINTVYSMYKQSKTNSDLANVLKDANTNELSYSISLRVSWLVNKKYHLSTGIGFANLQSKFDYVNQKETKVLVKDHLTSFAFNPVTQDTFNRVYRDVLFDATEKRSVINYNTFTLISLPLEFGFEKNINSFDFGLNMGVSYNFFITQKGKSLDKDGQIEYFDNKSNTILPFKESFFAFQLSPYIDWSIAKNIDFRLNPVIKYQLHGKSSLYNLTQNAVFIGFNVGLAYKL